MDSTPISGYCCLDELLKVSPDESMTDRVEPDTPPLGTSKMRVDLVPCFLRLRERITFLGTGIPLMPDVQWQKESNGESKMKS